ncbi:MAG: hypothetical protein WCY77_07520 [Weeksellaceae bacterium]|jgi:hypothetical protein
MKTIKFFHPEGKFTYYIEKCFCKVVYVDQQHQLLIEVHSTDDLDHVEEDSLQNEFSQVILTIDDFPVPFENLDELVGQTIDIPTSYVEIEDEEGELDDYLYTHVNFSEEDFEADDNELSFYKNEAGTLCLKWKGRVQNFTEHDDEYIPFELECEFSKPKFEIND